MASLQEIEAEIAQRQATEPQVAGQPSPPTQLAGVDRATVDSQVEFEAGTQRRAQPPTTGGFQLPQFGAPTQPQPEIPGLPTAPDFLTGADRTTRATQGLPELGTGGLLSGEDPAKIAAVSPVLLTTTNPREMGNILSSQFENVRITEDEKGNLIANNNATGAQVVINQPGVSQLDILQGLGIAATFTPAAKLAGAGKTIAQKATLGGISAGLTETGVQLAQGAAGGEVNEEDIALASALGVSSEVAMPLIQRFRQGRAAAKQGVAREELEQIAPAVREAQTAARETGVPLFQAQQTTVPAQLEKQAFIGQLPAGTQAASNALRNQNRAAANAVDDFLGQIAPDQAVVTGAEKFRTAAQSAVANAKRIRAEKTSPIYNRAFDAGADISLKPVNDLIKAGLDEFPAGGEVAKSLNRINIFLKGTKGRAPTLKQLHNAKLEIDQMINKVGSDSLGNTTKSTLKDVKSTLLNQIDEGSDLYRQARQAFEAESPPVTAMQESIIGKVAELDDTQLKNVAKRIFDPTETNPAVIKQAKKVISDVDPDAWNQLLRTELERRLGAVKADLNSVTAENVPGQLHRSIFGNTKQRSVLFNSVDGEAKRNLGYLETVLKRASLGRPGGSQTAAREEIKRELRGGALSGIREFFKKPVSTLISTGEDAAFNKRVKNLADAMFDPQWKPRMKEIRKLKIDSPAAARAIVQLLNDVEEQQ
jgi:hypothetical protein